MDWSRRKVLVTGAGGFIGSHLTESLVQAGAQVRVFVRYNSRNDRGYIQKLSPKVQNAIEISVGDLKDPEAIRKAIKQCNTVFHLGALIAIPYSYVNPMDFVQTNVVGTANVLNACLEGNIESMVHVSTSEVYGTLHYTPIDEEHSILGKSPYSASKIGADQLVLSYHRSFNLPAIIVRPFNTYGPRQSQRAIIPTIISQALCGEQIILGSLHPTRDFNYVEDTVRGIIKAANLRQNRGEIINLGTGVETSIKALATMILEICGRDLPIIQDHARVRPAPSEVERLICDNTKARMVLEWQPRVSLRAGLEKTVEWMRNVIDSKVVHEYVI